MGKCTEQDSHTWGDYRTPQTVYRCYTNIKQTANAGRRASRLAKQKGKFSWSRVTREPCHPDKELLEAVYRQTSRIQARRDPEP